MPSPEPPAPARTPRPRRRVGRAAVLWGLGLFAAGQMVFVILIDTVLPEMRDPEWGYRRLALRRFRAGRPDVPLAVVVGSSRVGQGFVPESLPAGALTAPDGTPAAAFSVTHAGAGPIHNLLTLNRLIADGHRPDWLVIEVMPAFLRYDERYSENYWLNFHTFGTGDLRVLHGRVKTDRLWANWARCRAMAWHRHRVWILNRLAPDWVIRGPTFDDFRGRGALGGPAAGMPRPSPAQRWAAVRQTHSQYAHAFPGLSVGERPARALDDTLHLCRRAGIAVALLLMPEGDEFRAWCPPDAAARIDGFLRTLAAEHHVPLIDARRWMPGEAFVDGHHLTADGAEAFTSRLAAEGLQPLISGRSAPPSAPGEPR